MVTPHTLPPDAVAREPMRWQVKLVLAGTAVVLLVALYAWLEHERAKARLAAYRRHLTERGEKLDVKDLLPPPVKLEDNAAPELLAGIAHIQESPQAMRPDAMLLAAVGRARVAWQQAELPNPRHENVWPDLAAEVENQRAVLATAAKALERPHWQTIPSFEDPNRIKLGYFTRVRRLARWQACAVLVDLHQERAGLAVTNLLAFSRLSARLSEEPLLLSQMGRYAIDSEATPVLWELVLHPQVTDAQLAELQSVWASIDYLKPFVRALELTQAWASQEFDLCRAEPNRVHDFAVSDHKGRPYVALGKFALEQLPRNPRAALQGLSSMWHLAVWPMWNSYHDERRFRERTQVWLELSRAAQDAPSAFPAAQRISDAKARLPTAPDHFYWSSVSVGYHELLRASQSEAVRRLVVTAIALERHHRRHGTYPETLAALVPALLREVPVDFYDAQPLRYRREPDGTFALWSVGEDGVDNGGPIPPPPGVAPSRTLSWLSGQDLVWPEPASEPEVATLHARFATERAAKK